MRHIALATLLALAPAPLLGQSTLLARLRQARSLKCQFPVTAALNWKSGDAKPQITSQDFGFNIDGIDYKAGTARLVGNIGAEDLHIIDGTKVITFVEVTVAGNVNVTTVFADSTGGSNRYKAVHSRHVMMIGGPLPSQAYGYCELWG